MLSHSFSPPVSNPSNARPNVDLCLNPIKGISHIVRLDLIILATHQICAGSRFGKYLLVILCLNGFLSISHVAKLYNDLFRITSWTDIMLKKDIQWTVKTLVREAVNSDSPEATKGKGIQEHTLITLVAYRFEKDIYKFRIMWNIES